ncbi:type II toxin-antitoxin system MqsR family toxin [Solimonas terrae]|uniref:Type II toxin-antitoxin system MqsR family toxin n=1 Tax=Solimonas terrae TaxID=1396819 RepID=A0A6M2BWG2_9GAMM|nr:type II toxin-antitoxin system MqsR family toxin [Solimonas terrae]NGY06982.1 type II toxin-antitoxin system MqsR family toxin [Solimonas terrae]
MEKRRPHYRLELIRTAVAQHRELAFTASARTGVMEMGLSLEQALLVIADLESRAFYKSMTTLVDHKLWQDVYHAPTPAGMAYVKFTLRDGSVVISFKRL